MELVFMEYRLFLRIMRSVVRSPTFDAFSSRLIELLF